MCSEFLHICNFDLSVSSQIFKLVIFSNDLFDTVTWMKHEQNVSQHLLLQASSTGNRIQMQGEAQRPLLHLDSVLEKPSYKSQAGMLETW